MFYYNSSLFNIIEARKADLEQIVNLINQAYWDQQQPYFDDNPESRKRIGLSDLFKLMSNPDQKIFVLINITNHDIAGVITIEFPKEEQVAKFGLFAMAKKYSGKRLGNVLVEYIENYAVSQAKKLMKIEVFSFAKNLISHYERLGYSLTGKTNTFFHECFVRADFQNSSKEYLLEMTKNFHDEYKVKVI